MPEGPEVRRCADNLTAMLYGKNLLEINTISGKLHRTGIPGLDKLLQHQPFKTGQIAVREITTHGKNIFIQLGRDHVLVSTLGMSGWWYPAARTMTHEQKTQKVHYMNREVEMETVIMKALNHTRVELITEDGTVACYTDARNFGNMEVRYGSTQRELIAAKKLGPDGLQLNNTRDLFTSICSSRGAIGEVLLKQNVIAGIGNIYRAEIMYLARINPYKTADELTEEEIYTLVKLIRYVLQLAYVSGGAMGYPTTLLKFVGADDLSASMMFGPGPVSTIKGHCVYGRKIDPLGNVVVHESQAGRTLWWCPKVQA